MAALWLELNTIEQRPNIEVNVEGEPRSAVEVECATTIRWVGSTNNEREAATVSV